MLWKADKLSMILTFLLPVVILVMPTYSILLIRYKMSGTKDDKIFAINNFVYFTIILKMNKPSTLFLMINDRGDN